MKAVADSGPLIHLAAVRQFDLLRLYFSELLVPRAVFQEVVVAGRGQPGSPETDTAQRRRWITVTDPRESSGAALLVEQGMSPTDAAVVALARAHPDHILLADDLAVRTAALAAGLQVYGTIGLLIDAKRDGHLPSLKQALDTLIQSGFYLDPRSPLYREALHLAGEA